MIATLRKLHEVGLIRITKRTNQFGKVISTVYCLLLPGVKKAYSGSKESLSPTCDGLRLKEAGSKEDLLPVAVKSGSKESLPKVNLLEVNPLKKKTSSLFDGEEVPEKPAKPRRKRPVYPAAFLTWWSTYPNFGTRGKQGETFAEWEALQGEVVQGEVLTVASLQNIAENARDYYRDEPQGNEFAAGSELFLRDEGKFSRFLHGMPAHSKPRNGRAEPVTPFSDPPSWQTQERRDLLKSLEHPGGDYVE